MKSAQEVLQERGISLSEFDPAAVAKLDAELAKLEKAAIALKEEQMKVRERKLALRQQWDELVRARSYLIQEVREPQPGDVKA